MAFIKGMNVKISGRDSWNGVQQGDERQKRVEGRRKWRSSRG
ncbi:hypothetical protein PU629_14420 [Pullulanibacillus sp. KACC 23026]|nr:hypothetical protein [Pullulanibacillus sp. KACC 23026]WEG11352.1 hypothetical protein PU629_14420 [Pullulanibacillus sp. KACC 23026]